MQRQKNVKAVEVKTMKAPEVNHYKKQKKRFFVFISSSINIIYEAHLPQIFQTMNRSNYRCLIITKSRKDLSVVVFFYQEWSFSKNILYSLKGLRHNLRSTFYFLMHVNQWIK